MLPDGVDAYWAINDDEGQTGQADAKIIFENTGTGYTFGLFDKNNNANKLEMFTSSSITGDKAVVTILGDAPGGISLQSGNTIHFTGWETATFAGNNFGFYLTTLQDVTFYSDTLLNSGQIDRMTAGIVSPGCEYQLSWDGFTVNVESVAPTPEPATLFLLTLGGLALRKKH
jgi:hypothetical protein